MVMHCSDSAGHLTKGGVHGHAVAYQGGDWEPPGGLLNNYFCVQKETSLIVRMVVCFLLVGFFFTCGFFKCGIHGSTEPH